MLPVLALVLGAFPGRDELADFTFAGAEVERLFLPGFHCPRTPELSIAAFASALDSQIEQRFEGRDVTVMGLSTGALAALALRRPEVRRLILVEPFFSMVGAAPLVGWLQRILEKYPENSLLHEWVQAIFGTTISDPGDRNYRCLLDANQRPLWVVTGDSTSSTDGLPSLTSPQDRALLAAAGARMSSYSGGHAPPYSALLAAAREALRDATEDDKQHGTRGSCAARA